MAIEVSMVANEVQRPGCRPRRLWVCGPASLNYYSPAHSPRPDFPVEPCGKPGTPLKPPKSCTSIAMELAYWPRLKDTKFRQSGEPGPFLKSWRFTGTLVVRQAVHKKAWCREACMDGPVKADAGIGERQHSPIALGATPKFYGPFCHGPQHLCAGVGP